MREISKKRQQCALCKKTFLLSQLVPGETLRESIVDEIRRVCPDWTQESFICRSDLAVIRAQRVQSLLESEKGELTSLERAVVESLKEHEILSSHLDAEAQEEWSLGERLADRIASFGGSWVFLICFGVFLAIWVLVNSLTLLIRPVDPYPFILLNLVLSCLAAIQAPIIMMSQNRQEAKDRLRARYDYQINLKAELEIRHLHEKLDHLLLQQWQRLVEIQEMQLEVLEELGRVDGGR